MFSMNKDTMMIVAVVVALLATFYLYRETNKNKLDIQKLMEPVPPQAVITPPKSILKKEKVQVPATSTTMVADDVEQ
jgi:hypothetical protein